MTIRTTLVSLAALTLWVGTARAAPTFYVLDSANAHATAGGNAGIGNDAHSFTSGKLPQTAYVNSASATTSGAVLEFDGTSNPLTYPQTASSYVEDDVHIGAMHTHLHAQADTFLYAIPGTPFTTGHADSSAANDMFWSDTVHYHTTNPLGSDFTFSLHVDDAEFANGTWYSYDMGSVGASIVARVDFTNSNNVGLGYAQSMFIQDGFAQQSDGTVTSSRSPDHDQSVIVHADPGAFYDVVITGHLFAAASVLNGTGSADVIASNTALFGLSSSDPLAVYTADSGTVFATPEPATLLAGAVGMLLLRRPRRSR